MSDQPDKKLIEEARRAQAKAYARYSGYKVGAALRAASGRVYAGCNIENAAYPMSQCAEANAIAAMVMGGDRKIAEVAVIGPGPVLCTPCGGCRQALAEFGGPDTPVHICGPDGDIVTETLGALIPHAFGPENLGESGS